MQLSSDNPQETKNRTQFRENVDVRLWIPPFLHYSAPLSEFDAHLENLLGPRGKVIGWGVIGVTTLIGAYGVYKFVQSSWKGFK